MLKSMLAFSNYHVLLVETYAYMTNFIYSYRSDFEAGYQDFKCRLDNYEKVTLTASKVVIDCGLF